MLARKEAELLDLKTRLDLRELYTRELHALLDKQAQTLEDLDRRLSALEPEHANGPAEANKLPKVRIRIKKRL